MTKVNVRVCYFAGLRELMGVREEVVPVEEGTTLADLLLKHLPARHPGVGEEFTRALFDHDSAGRPVLSRRYLVLVNGQLYTSLPGGLGYRLKDGDTVLMFPPLGGG